MSVLPYVILVSINRCAFERGNKKRFPLFRRYRRRTRRRQRPVSVDQTTARATTLIIRMTRDDFRAGRQSDVRSERSTPDVGAGESGKSEKVLLGQKPRRGGDRRDETSGRAGRQPVGGPTDRKRETEFDGR